MRRASVLTLCFLAASVMAGSSASQTITRKALSFGDLTGWVSDDHGAALRAFNRSCDKLRGGRLIRRAEWQDVCARARMNGLRAARSFLEDNFLPVLVRRDSDALFTGYYEPVLQGAVRREGPYQHPLYAPPPDLPRSSPWLTRAQIDGGALTGRGLEIVWLKDPVEAFFLHIQGSGRIALDDGTFMRVGFAGRNNHKYRSVGMHLMSRGVLPKNQLSAEKIASWVSQNPKEGRAALHHNKSYIFFRVLNHDLNLGPLGAMDIPLTPMRSIAVDRRHVPLGAPVWVETTTRDGVLNQLMVAQDVGAAIKGVQRADIFFGWGKPAYRLASRQKDSGRIVQLWPRSAALRLPR